MEKQERIDKIIFIILKGLVFLMPLFFLPWTASVFGMDNFNKQYLLWLSAPILFGLWACRLRLDQCLKLKVSLIDLAVIVYLAANMIASLFGSNVYISFFGSHNAAGQPLLTTLCLAVIYLAVRSLEWPASRIKAMFETMIWVWAIVVVLMAFQVLNLGDLFSRDQILRSYQLAFGNLDELAVYLAVMAVIVFAHLRQFGWARRWISLAVKTCLVLCLLIMGIINSAIAWSCLLLGIVLALFLQIRFLSAVPSAESVDQAAGWQGKYSRFFGHDFWPLFLFLFAIIALAFHFSASGPELARRRLAMDMQLGFSNSWQIARDAIVARPLFGFGPDSAGHAISRLRGTDLNATEFWNLRFIRSGSYFPDTIITTGLAGFGAYLFLIISAGFGVLKLIGRGQTEENNGLFVPAAASACLLFGQVFFPANILLLFLFWFLLGLSAAAIPLPALWSAAIKKEDSAYNPLFAAGLIILAGWIGLSALEGKFWLAEYYYSQGEAGYARAVALNPDRADYQAASAKAHLAAAQTAMAENSSAGMAKAQAEFNLGIAAAKAAVAADKNSVAAFETLGAVYRTISQYSADSRPLAIAAFERAAALEPANPVVLTEIGRLYLEAGMTETAMESFNKAIVLKSDYAAAKFYSAKALAADNKSEEAIAALTALIGAYNDADVYYELGLINFNRKDFENAIVFFSEVLKLSPLHANSLYSLALSYEAAGDKAEALYYFKKVQALNPGNAEVGKKVKELE